MICHSIDFPESGSKKYWTRFGWKVWHASGVVCQKQVQFGAIITQSNITWYWIQNVVIDVENMSEFEPPIDTPYHALTGELWGVYCKNLSRNWLSSNGPHGELWGVYCKNLWHNWFSSNGTTLYEGHGLVITPYIKIHEIIGHIGYFRWLGPNVWWEISQIRIEYIKPIRRMNHESFSGTLMDCNYLSMPYIPAFSTQALSQIPGSGMQVFLYFTGSSAGLVLI